MEKTQIKTSILKPLFLIVEKVRKWARKNPKEAMILALILLVAAVFRLYRIDEYMTFLGDEGRDVIVVRRLLVDADPILIGPGTSIGDMYLGPLYYYMMAPALLLANFSPAGPAIQIALLGVITVFFVWYVAREWFSPRRQGFAGQASIAGLVAAGLYAISPTVIIYSRSSWNPNIMPFFSLLTIYAIWKMWFQKEFKWMLIAGVSFAFVLQSHYLGLLLAPTIGFFWLLTFLKVKKDTGNKVEGIRRYLSYTLYAGVLFAVLMSPLVVFDARHDWRNFASMKRFFIQRQTTVSARPWNALPKLNDIFAQVSTRLIAGKNEILGRLVTLFLSLGIIYICLRIYKGRFEEKGDWAYLLLFTWIFVGLIGLGVYKQHIYDHYFGFFFPAPFLLIGGIAQKVVQSTKNIGKVIVFIAFLLLLINSLKTNPLKYPPNRQLQRTEEVARKIIEEARSEKFNIAVLAERNYEGAYQYFLERWSAPFIMIDPQRADETITEQLFVVCELPEEKCDPTHNPKAEVANFGWSRIEKEWQVAGVVLYKLVHTQ